MAEYCLKKGCEVHGTIRWRSNRENINHIKNIYLHECDLTDAHAIKEIIKEIKPSKIFHLSAQSYVPASWTSPMQTLDNNIRSELNLLEAVKGIENYKPLIQIAGSSEEYGNAKEVPITENTPLIPVSPYGVSKVTQDLLARQYFKSYGIRSIVTRGFNHTGKRRGEVFVCSSFAKQIAEIEKGIKEPVIKHGNLESERDFTDVRDMVNAYWLALEKGVPGEVYNICSEKKISIRKVLEILMELSKSKITLEEDEERMRPSDLKTLLGSCKKFRKQTGWKREYEIEETLKEILDYWRNKTSQKERSAK